jgi:hypothetical protein
MSDRKIGAVARELIEAKKRIEDPANWCTPLTYKRGRMCAMTALIEHGGGYDLLSQVSLELFDGLRPHQVNDKLGHAAVMQMYTHAINRALNEGK